MARALDLALQKKLRGVFNVAGPQPVPFSVLVRETGRKPMPIPQFLFNAMLGRFGLPRLPPGALEHIKYPVVIDGAAFRAATGFTYEVDEVQAMHEFRDAFPPPKKR